MKNEIIDIDPLARYRMNLVGSYCLPMRNNRYKFSESRPENEEIKRRDS